VPNQKEVHFRVARNGLCRNPTEITGFIDDPPKSLRRVGGQLLERNAANCR
jgi:hypothetical protein